MTEATETKTEETKKPLGNELFQQCVLKPYAQALEYAKKYKRELTPAQAKAKRKNRAKAKVQKASRKRNRG